MFIPCRAGTLDTRLPSPPASTRSTDTEGSSESLAATTAPALPAPTTMKSKDSRRMSLLRNSSTPTGSSTVSLKRLMKNPMADMRAEASVDSCRKYVTRSAGFHMSFKILIKVPDQAPMRKPGSKQDSVRSTFWPVSCHCSDMTSRHFFCSEPSVMMRLYNAVPTRGQHLLVDVSPDAGLTGHRHMSLTKQLSDFLGWESNPRSSDHGSDALTIWPSKLPYAQLIVQSLVQSNEQTIEYGAVMVNRVPNRAARPEQGS